MWQRMASVACSTCLLSVLLSFLDCHSASASPLILPGLVSNAIDHQVGLLGSEHLQRQSGGLGRDISTGTCLASIAVLAQPDLQTRICRFLTDTTSGSAAPHSRSSTRTTETPPSESLLQMRPLFADHRSRNDDDHESAKPHSGPGTPRNRNLPSRSSTTSFVADEIEDRVSSSAARPELLSLVEDAEVADHRLEAGHSWFEASLQLQHQITLLLVERKELLTAEAEDKLKALPAPETASCTTSTTPCAYRAWRQSVNSRNHLPFLAQFEDAYMDEHEEIGRVLGIASTTSSDVDGSGRRRTSSSSGRPSSLRPPAANGQDRGERAGGDTASAAATVQAEDELGCRLRARIASIDSQVAELQDANDLALQFVTSAVGWNERDRDGVPSPAAELAALQRLAGHEEREVGQRHPISSASSSSSSSSFTSSSCSESARMVAETALRARARRVIRSGGTLRDKYWASPAAVASWEGRRDVTAAFAACRAVQAARNTARETIRGSSRLGGSCNMNAPSGRGKISLRRSAPQPPSHFFLAGLYTCRLDASVAADLENELAPGAGLSGHTLGVTEQAAENQSEQLLQIMFTLPLTLEFPGETRRLYLWEKESRNRVIGGLERHLAAEAGPARPDPDSPPPEFDAQDIVADAVLSVTHPRERNLITQHEVNEIVRGAVLGDAAAAGTRAGDGHQRRPSAGSRSSSGGAANGVPPRNFPGNVEGRTTSRSRRRTPGPPEDDQVHDSRGSSIGGALRLHARYVNHEDLFSLRASDVYPLSRSWVSDRTAASAVKATVANRLLLQNNEQVPPEQDHDRRRPRPTEPARRLGGRPPTDPEDDASLSKGKPHHDRGEPDHRVPLMINTLMYYADSRVGTGGARRGTLPTISHTTFALSNDQAFPSQPYLEFGGASNGTGSESSSSSGESTGATATTISLVLYPARFNLAGPPLGRRPVSFQCRRTSGDMMIPEV